MSKQLRNLIIAVVVLVLAAGAYFMVSSKEKAQKQEESVANVVYNDSKAKIVKIEVSTPAETGTLVKQDVNWVIEGKENVELGQRKC